MTKQVHPIGIFDSGIGGLTVTHAITQQLPKENIIYFGDTEHMPYGPRSAATIQSYSVKIAHTLLQQNCKLILIACGTASAAAYELVKEYVGSKAIVMNVIDPVIHHLRDNYAHKHVGLIATRQTVNSNVYKKKIDALNRNITLTPHATNLLASAIEEFHNHRVIDSLLEEYLSHFKDKKLDALILGSTHYPVIKDKVINYFDKKIDVIDPSDIVARAVKHKMDEHNLHNTNGESTKQFYVSEYTDSFAAGTKIFFKEDITLEHYPLWE